MATAPPALMADPSSVVVALDVGGTSIKAAVIDGAGRLKAETRRDTGVAEGVAAVVENIVGLTADLARQFPAVIAAGIGVPGVVEPATGMARFAANLGWRDLPLAALVTARTGLPVALGHDVRNAALAEARLGAGRAARSLFFVSLGTGVAGGMITDGVVDDGASGQAGELGHLVVRPGGDACGCGNRGCLETVASASRIGLRYRALTGRIADARTVATLMASGDAAAQQVWTDAVDALADGLAAVVVLTDPGVVVLGGGLSLAGDALLRPLSAALSSRLTFRVAPPLILTDLGDRAGVLGAAVRAFDVFGAAR